MPDWLAIVKAYIDDLETRLTAARAGYLDNINNAELLNISAARLGYIDLLADGTVGLAALEALVDDLETAVGAIEGATTLHNKLTAARAALLDQITAVRLAELDAANLPSDIDSIKAVTDATLALTETGGTIAADGTEQTVILQNAPAVLFRPICVTIDLDNMAGGDTTVIRFYKRITVAGALQQYDEQTYTGADGGLLDGDKLVEFELQPNRFGIQVTLQQTAGVNRNYDWEYIDEE